VDAVKYALSNGYRHIDTAQIYENEDAVGTAIKESEIPRDEIFLTTKIWMDSAHDGDVQKSMEESLRKLKVEYADLVLMHWPIADVPFEETFRAFEDIRQRGMTRSIGVSNFTVAQMKDVKETLGIDIVCNQVEYHPALSQQPVLNYIQTHKMFLTAYCPLGRGEVLYNSAINDIADRHHKSPAQVVLRWLVQQEDVVAIPKAGTKSHIRENFDVFDFNLSEEEMHEIYNQARDDGRIINPAWAPEWDSAKAA